MYLEYAARNVDVLEGRGCT